MSSRRSWAAALVVVPSLGACVPAEELSSYSRGSGASSGGEGSGAGGLQVSSNAPPMPGGGPSREDPPASEALDASAAGGERTDGGGPATPEVTDVDAGSDAGDPAQAACDGSEVSGPRGNCYLEVATAVPWADARANCQALGAGWDLASIRSNADAEFWASRLTFEVWLGASDGTNEGVWSWVSDGAQFWVGDGVTGAPVNGAFANWNTDEPNGGENSDCARMLPRTDPQPDRNAPWADLECAELLGALCEGPADQE